MKSLNTENRAEEQFFTDGEWDAELLSQFPEVGPTRSAGWIYGIEWTYQNADAWKVLEGRWPAERVDELRRMVTEKVGEFDVIESGDDSIPE